MFLHCHVKVGHSSSLGVGELRGLSPDGPLGEQLALMD